MHTDTAAERNRELGRCRNYSSIRITLDDDDDDDDDDRSHDKPAASGVHERYGNDVAMEAVMS